MYLAHRNFNQLGFAPIALVVLLLFGIAAGTLLIQNRTNLFPQADEDSRPEKLGSETGDPICSNGRKAYYCLYPRGWTCIEKNGCTDAEIKNSESMLSCPSEFPYKSKFNNCYKTFCDYSDGFTEFRDGRCYQSAAASCPYEERYDQYQCENGKRCFFNMYRNSETNCTWANQRTETHCDDDPTCGTPPAAQTPSGTISADPNPCIIQEGRTTCDTTIRWTSSNATQVTIIGLLVTAVEPSGEDLFFVQEIPKSLSLYGNDASGTRIKLASVTVSGKKSAAPAAAADPKAGGCSQAQIDNCINTEQKKGGCYLSSSGRPQCLYASNQTCNDTDASKCSTKADCHIISGEAKCNYDKSSTPGVCSPGDETFCQNVYGTACAVVNRGGNIISDCKLSKCNTGWLNYCKTFGQYCKIESDGVPNCTTEAQTGQILEPTAPAAAAAATAPKEQKPSLSSGAVNPAAAAGAPGSRATVPGAAPATPIITNCGKNADGRDIPCYQIGVFNDAQTLASTEAGANLASERYTQYEEIMAKINSKLSEEIRQKADEKLKAAQAAAAACLAR